MMIIPSHVAHPCYMVTGGPGLPLCWPIPPRRISPSSGCLIWPTQVHGLHNNTCSAIQSTRTAMTYDSHIPNKDSIEVWHPINSLTLSRLQSTKPQFHANHPPHSTFTHLNLITCPMHPHCQPLSILCALLSFIPRIADSHCKPCLSQLKAMEGIGLVYFGY